MTTADPRAYANRLERLLPEMLGLTERIVNIDSGSHDAAGVNAVADEIQRALEALSFSVERRPLDGRGDQLTATLEIGHGPALLILGHGDTVWPAGTVAEWSYCHRNGRLEGPGVGDMKSCLVTAIYALRVLLEYGDVRLGSIRYLLVPDEELGSAGSRAWIEDEARSADVCLALEAGAPGGGVVTSRGAVGALILKARGISAHCSSDAGGASAVAALAPLVTGLEALSQPDSGVRISVGIFRGGSARQVVPDRAELHLDIRAPDDATTAAAIADVEDVVARVDLPAGVRIELEGGIMRPAFPRSVGTRGLYRAWAELGAALEAPVFEMHERGSSDGSFAAALGVPTLDGVGPLCHESCSRREWVEIDSMVERGALVAALAAALAEGTVEMA